jgi:formylglycine-generating enzyme required for sulfatase activity
VHRFVPIAIVVACSAAALTLGALRRDRDDGARCGRGFQASGPRCVIPAGTCPPPLVPRSEGCDAPDLRVLVPATEMAAGAPDWDGEGRGQPRVIRVAAFRVDAFEATAGQWRRAAMGDPGRGEPSRAMSGMTRAEAEEYCERRGGGLPSEDEWIVAAASAATPPRRYPWGDTGAVCRRGAWGLRTGPCSLRGTGPDTVGAHGDGASPLGVYDLAGNVAEWIAPAEPDADRASAAAAPPDADASDASSMSGRRSATVGIAKGGSWQSALAAELRIWARVELPATARDPSVGVRCVYPP